MEGDEREGNGMDHVEDPLFGLKNK